MLTSLALFCLSAPLGDPAAIAVRVWGGAVTIQGKEVVAGFSLAENTSISLGEGAQLSLVTIGDMTRWECRGESVVKVSRGGLVPVSGAKPIAKAKLRSRKNVKLKPPKQTMARAGGVLTRGDETSRPRSLRPVGMLRTPQVVLSWTPPATGNELRVRLRWNNGSHVVDLPPGATSYTVPAGILPEGDTVTWSVTSFDASVAGGAAGSWFEVATRETLSFVSAWDDLEISEPEDAVARAFVYEQAGFLLDALADLQYAAKTGREGLGDSIKRLEEAIDGSTGS